VSCPGEALKADWIGRSHECNLKLNSWMFNVIVLPYHTSRASLDSLAFLQLRQKFYRPSHTHILSIPLE